MKLKNYILIFFFVNAVSLACAQDTIRAASHLYVSGSVGFVTPVLSFGSNPSFYDNYNNSFGSNGYAIIGGGANVGLTYLSDGIPFGLTCTGSYYYNKVSTDFYVAQVNTFLINHFRAIAGTGYKQLSLLGGITISTEGKDSWIDVKLLGGIMYCCTPFVEDSGHCDYAPPGSLQQYGPNILQPSSKLAPAWGIGVEARPVVSKHLFFLFSATLVAAFPTINTTQQITYFDATSKTYVTQTTPYQYKLNLTSVYISVGAAFKI